MRSASWSRPSSSCMVRKSTASSGCASLSRCAVRMPLSGRHRDVEQDQVGLQRGRQAQRLAAVRRLADHLEVGGGREQCPEAGADHGVVVSDQDADRHSAPPPRSSSPCRASSPASGCHPARRRARACRAARSAPRSRRARARTRRRRPRSSPVPVRHGAPPSGRHGWRWSGARRWSSPPERHGRARSPRPAAGAGW